MNKKASRDDPMRKLGVIGGSGSRRCSTPTPENWDVLRIGEMFSRRCERGRAGLPVMSITMTGGLVARASVERRVESNLPPEGHLLVRAGDLAYNMMRMWQGVLGRGKFDCLVSPAYIVLQPSEKVDPQFAEYLFSTATALIQFKRLSYGVVDDRLRLYYRDLVRIPFLVPRSRTEQSKIAEILSTVDETIKQTEALIAKYLQIKAGLMHDLFTRGVTAEGRLRPTRAEAPQIYKESPFGWLPSEWQIESIEGLAESLVDGPFGSNLKTEHYVAEPGVRVVRLQNIEDGDYNDRNRAFISSHHAGYLARNQVKPGDVLIAGLGEDVNVAGRACCYPVGLPNAINKADCFRLRCKESIAFNKFVMYFLNTDGARKQIRRFEQGVTRRRINTTNLKKVTFGLPSIAEQESIITLLNSVATLVAHCIDARDKLGQQKLGLMHDLLTGSVRVKAVESEGASA